jgi:hypothetical protein
MVSETPLLLEVGSQGEAASVRRVQRQDSDWIT